MRLSEFVVPALLCFVGVYGACRRTDVYGALTKGAEEGLSLLIRILPSLVGLFTAVYMFRASGAADCFARWLAPTLTALDIPPACAPLLLVRPISGSGALAVGAELMAAHGVDSYVGRVAAVMLGSSETTFYTVAVYYGAAGIGKTRYTIPAALVADGVMFVLSACAVRWFFGA